MIDKFRELLDAYWSAAYDQGVSQASHDDENRTAENAELAVIEYVDRLTRELAEARDKALEEAAKVAASSIMKFRRRANGMYYAGYHEDMRDQTAAAIRALKASP
ncbi:hypothetical protein [Microcystis phage Mwe-JY13]